MSEDRLQGASSFLGKLIIGRGEVREQDGETKSKISPRYSIQHSMISSGKKDLKPNHSISGPATRGGISGLEDYGLIHRTMEDMVIQKHNAETWIRILEEAGFEQRNNPVITNVKYEDGVTLKLFSSAAKVLGLTKDEVMEEFGRHFIAYSIECGYDKQLRCLGATFADALMNFDSLVEHLTVHYPGLKHPTFYVELMDDRSMLLYYFSIRKGLESLLIGVLKEYAKILYDLSISVSECAKVDSCTPTVFNVQCTDDEIKDMTSSHNVCSRSKLSRHPRNLPIKPWLFRKLFPFHILMRSDSFDIMQLGESLNRFLFNSLKQTTKTPNFSNLFEILRPQSINNSQKDVQLNKIYVVETKLSISGTKNSARLRLKGQMIEVNSRTILLLTSPQVYTYDDMIAYGLKINDIAAHDNLRNIIAMNHSKRDNASLLKNLEEGSNSLKDADLQLRRDKKRTEDVLHSILPAKIARRLYMNLPVEAELHEVVTCLFTDIVGFTEMCARPSTHPMDIVRTLNSLYSAYDELLNEFLLYKIETIGDAYMAVCNLQNKVDDHADRTIDMGLRMVETTRQMFARHDRFDIRIRVGIHTGSVLSGVVGVKMPRYCLFGHTVTLANWIESWSKASKVNISYITKRYIRQSGRYNFKLREERRQMVCYFVEHKDKPKQNGDCNVAIDALSQEERTTLKNEDVDCCLLEEILLMSQKGSSCNASAKTYLSSCTSNKSLPSGSSKNIFHKMM